MKVYQIIFQDEWNNLGNLGSFKQLKDSINDINGLLSVYGVTITENDLVERLGTFGPVFDTSLYDITQNEEIPDIMIRGFIFDFDESIIKYLTQEEQK